jgi:hypothetical protein
MIAHADIAATIRATWPPVSTRSVGQFDLGDGAGGGNRVSAARLHDPLSDGVSVTPEDLSGVVAAQRAEGAEALFMVFDWQDALDRTLAAEGYAIRDETLILAAPVAGIAEAPPPVSCFEVWPPLPCRRRSGSPAASAPRVWPSCTGPKVRRPPSSVGSMTVPPGPPSSRFTERSRCSTRSRSRHARGEKALPVS